MSCARTLPWSRQRRARLALVMALVVTALGWVGAARASATEPVFDTTYDTRLGNILRGTMSTSSGDYLALQDLGAQSLAGDLTASHVLGQLQRVRADIGDAVPLRKISLPGGPTRYYFWTNSGEYWQKIQYPKLGGGWSLTGNIAGSHPCAVSESDPIGVDFHLLNAPSGLGCFIEADQNYNDDDATIYRRATFGSFPAGQTVSWANYCQYASAPWTYHPSLCVAHIVTDHELWGDMAPLSNMQVYASQTYDQSIGYTWWDTSWNPFNAPTTQSTSLSDGRAEIDDADNATLRQWLNHLFDAADYGAPLPVQQTMGNCAQTPNNLASDPCEQARR